MFSLMFVAAYYYVSLRHHPMIQKQTINNEHDTSKNTYLSPKGHSSPISSPNLSKSAKSKVGKKSVRFLVQIPHHNLMLLDSIGQIIF